VLAETVAGPETILKLTSKPEFTVALSKKGASPKILPLKEPKEIVWLALITARFTFFSTILYAVSFVA
jgi:hypothetical protein